MSKRLTRVLSLVLTLVMFLSVSTPAFAIGGGDMGKDFGRDIGENEIRDFEPEGEIAEEEELDYFQTTVEANGSQVTVEAPMGALPTLAELRAEPVEIEDVRAAVESVMEGEANILLAMDISFWLNGIEIEPEEPVRVKISAPELDGKDNLTLVHIPDAAEPETVQLIDEDQLSFALGTNEIAFQADSFSIYVVAGGEDPKYRYTYNFVDGNGDPYPFLNTAGQTVTSQIIKNGESLQEVPAPGLLDGNAFNGWYYLNDDGSWGDQVVFDEPINVTANKTITIKAHYGNVIYVTFWQYAEGKVVLERKQLAVNEATGKATLDLSSVTNVAPSTRLKFMGWSLKPGTGDSETIGDTPDETDPNYRKVLPNSTYEFTVNTDVYPVYYAGLWIVFVSASTGSGATYVPSYFLTADSTNASAAKPSDPKLTGYTFDGWSTEEDPDYGTASDNDTFNFNSSFSDVARLVNDRGEVVLYGQWKPGTTTYVVVYWKQNVNDSKTAADNAKTYDYAGQTDPISANTGSAPTPSTAQQQADLGFEYKRYKLTDSEGEEITGIAPDGTSILNVYFDRKIITMYFGTRSSSWGSTSFDTEKTFTGLYGQTLAQNGYSWPSENGWYYRNNGTYSGGTEYAMSYLGQFVLPVNRITGANNTITTVYFYKTNSRTNTIYYYAQNANGTWPSSYDAGETTAGSIQIAQKYDGFTMDAYQYDNDGLGGNYRPNSWISVSPNESEKSVEDGMAIRYRRLSFEIKYLNPLDEAQILESKSLLFGASLSTAKPASSTEIDLGVPGYEWDGKWYKDKACTVEFNFDTETMPLDGTKVYAGKVALHYFVKVDPNGGELQTGQSTWRWAYYGQTHETYDTITRDYIEYKGTGTAYYYYYDEFDISRKEDIWNYQYMEDNPRTAQYTTGEIPEGGGAAWLSKEQYSHDLDAYQLIGWYKLNDDGSMTPFKSGTAITEDTVIQAQWRRTGEYKVHYAVEAVDESGEPLMDKDNARVLGWDSPVDSAKYADKSDSAIMDKMKGIPAGYNFVGWWYNGKMYQPGDVFQVLASLSDDQQTVHIYPVLEPVETLPVEVIDITFDANGGVFVEEIAATEVQAIIAAAKENDEGSYDPSYSFNTAKTTVTISKLKLNEKLAMLSGEAVVNGVTVNGKKVLGRGYRLKEWNTKADGSGTVFALDSVAGVDEQDVVISPLPNTLYAIWEEVFYVYHSANGKVDTISKGDTTARWELTTGFNKAGTENLTQYTSNYYGGYAVYAKGNEDAAGLNFENGEFKSGSIDASYWTRFKAAKSGDDWNISDTGAVYYLKEVPTSYLAIPVGITIRATYGEGPLTAVYFLTDTDTNIYRTGGVKLNGTDTKGAFSKTFTLKQNGTSNTKDITANSQFGAENGYLAVVNVAVDSAAEEYKQLQGFWTTYDGVNVYGIQTNIKDSIVIGPKDRK